MAPAPEPRRLRQSPLQRWWHTTRCYGGNWIVALARRRSVEESILDVELVDGPVAGDGEAEDDSDDCRLDDGTKSLVVVDAELLQVSANHPTHLEPSKGAICMKLEFENPFASDDINLRETRNQGPCVVVNQHLVFVMHCTESWRSSKLMRYVFDSRVASE
uniref:Uncharacterized protein n=1 Tax=Oryza brachyantha TaxID=4533 RepID=J3N9D8_ORYBR